MPSININGVQFFYKLSGSGETPLILVHGSWVSHSTWDAVLPSLDETFRVLTYDRRGHSLSEQPAGQGSVQEDVADLVALIEHLDLAPAWIVGNSAGASISLRLAAEHPDLLRGLVGHEPPLISLVANDPDFGPALEQVNGLLAAVCENIVSGDRSRAAEMFVDSVVIGPGAWAQFASEVRKVFIENAPTFLDEVNDPEAFFFEPLWCKGIDLPVLLTTGDHSPPFFASIVSKLVDRLPMGEVVSIAGAGHIPHETHPSDYVKIITGYISQHSVERLQK